MRTPEAPGELARRAAATALVVTLLALASGCGGEEEKLDPATPDGAFRIFMQAVENRDQETFWLFLDDSSRQVFDERLADLEEIERRILQYFSGDPFEQKRLRQLTGVPVLRQLQAKAAGEFAAEQLLIAFGTQFYEDEIRPSPEPTGRDLFERYVDLSQIPFEPDQRVGAEIDEMVPVEGEQPPQTRISTDAGTAYFMVQHTIQDRPHWRVANLRLLFEGALAPIIASKDAIQEYARENLAEERKRRARVIEYFEQRVRASATPTAAGGDDSDGEEVAN